MAKKSYLIEGLHCANCALKIEKEYNNLPYVDEAVVNPVTSKAIINFNTDEVNFKEVLSEIDRIASSIERGVKVKEIEKSIIKKNYLIEGLHCANCALKIEKEYNNLPYVDEAVVNPVTSKAIIKFNTDNLDFNEVLDEIDNIASSIEKGVKVKELGKDALNKEKKQCGGGCCCGNSHGGENGHSNEHSHEEANEDDHSHEEEGRADGNRTFAVKIVFSLLLSLSTFVVPESWKLPMFVLAYLVIGGDILLTSVNNISKGRIFDENFLMSIATIGAFFIGEYPEAVGVMLFYQIGEHLNNLAVERSRKSISDLMDIRPDYANLKSVDGSITKVNPENVSINDVIVIKPGEKVPLDGIVIGGESQLDTSSLTGESVPRIVRKDDSVLSGSINKSGLLEVKVTSEFGESTVSKILDLVENASNKKSPTEKFISKFARIYTPIVVFMALGIAVVPTLIFGQDFSIWLYRALSFLVVSCPCALVISVPLTFFAGIGGASRKGILVKGGNYLEDLGKAELVVFDKTGTLTEGTFEVTKVDCAEGVNKDMLMEYASYAELYSNHPIGKSIIESYNKMNEGCELDKSRISSYEEVAGKGIKIKLDGKDIYAGSYKYMQELGVKCSASHEVGTIVYVSEGSKLLGSLVISDRLKKNSKKAVNDLRNVGIKKSVMLTGDNRKIADYIGSEVGVDEICAELLPDQKVTELERLVKSMPESGKSIFVGDGINDAPVLALADIGIAMGGVGSDAAIEASDVVIMSDDPAKIADAILLARNTNKIAKENIFLALAIKVAVLALVALGIGNMWMAVFADVGVTLLAVLNSIRAMK